MGESSGFYFLEQIVRDLAAEDPTCWDEGHERGTCALCGREHPEHGPVCPYARAASYVEQSGSPTGTSLRSAQTDG